MKSRWTDLKGESILLYHSIIRQLKRQKILIIIFPRTICIKIQEKRKSNWVFQQCCSLSILWFRRTYCFTANRKIEEIILSSFYSWDSRKSDKIQPDENADISAARWGFSADCEMFSPQFSYIQQSPLNYFLALLPPSFPLPGTVLMNFTILGLANDENWRPLVPWRNNSKVIIALKRKGRGNGSVCKDFTCGRFYAYGSTTG